MSDTGMFDRIIDALVKKAGNSVIAITMLTALIAMIGHLDGSGASTFLITIPAMLPIYKRMNIRNTTLLTICVAAMGVMNLLPWGGPTMRTASVIEVDATLLWKELIPMQVVGIVLAFAVAFILGRIELKRGAGLEDVYKRQAAKGDWDAGRFHGTIKYRAPWGTPYQRRRKGWQESEGESRVRTILSTSRENGRNVFQLRQAYQDLVGIS